MERKVWWHITRNSYGSSSYHFLVLLVNLSLDVSVVWLCVQLLLLRINAVSGKWDGLNTCAPHTCALASWDTREKKKLLYNNYFRYFNFCAILWDPLFLWVFDGNSNVTAAGRVCFAVLLTINVEIRTSLNWSYNWIVYYFFRLNGMLLFWKPNFITRQNNLITFRLLPICKEQGLTCSVLAYDIFPLFFFPGKIL